MKATKLILGWVALILVVIMNMSVGSLETPAGNKKLIKYGWDAPTPTFFRKHIKDMDKLPFDGVMLKLNAGKEVFKRTSYPNMAFTQDQKDLIATKSSQLTDNFILMWSGLDQGWDWFDDADWAAAEKNIRNFAKTAAAGHFRGIAFDPEPYIGNTWKYNEQPLRSKKTFQEYQQRVRQRGGQFIRTLQTADPNMQLLTFGLMSFMRNFRESPTLADYQFGLWPDFVNGMLDGTKPDSVIIDGNEGSYYYINTPTFDRTRNFIFKDLKPFVDQQNRKKYEKNVKLGQAIYQDLVLDVFPDTSKDPRYTKTMQHFLSPSDRLKLLEHNVYHSLRTTDQYTWTYNESGDWWKGKFPKDAELAIRRAKQKIQKGQPLGFNINPAVEKALKDCKRVNQVNPALCASII
jgi:hypothetical protein